jgi:hypothetical protein
MTTSVKITAHNFPATVTVLDRWDGKVSGTETIIQDGEIFETHVTDTRSVTVTEKARP